MDDSNEEKVPNVPIIKKEELNDLQKELDSTNFKHKHLSHKSNYEGLLSLISEYLDSFVLVGYSLEGNEVIITKCDSPRDSRALIALLDDFSDNLYDKTMSNTNDYDGFFESDDEEE